ncbi:telomere-length maintenance and DNA damage repair-domain-containing protein [Syncephalis plumigaleata]|nr:telomere-length maintenance and DNA damage repair-domain-containing protein [Syncephalis plumigaleata]
MLDLHECCSLLCSSKSTERQEGESLLLRTLTAYRHEMIAQYTASDWTQLVEALLESIELERAALIGKERTAAGNARLETRMTRLARDLCTVIDLCYTQITPRLARILWESAIGVLPLRENELCEPLLLEYARVLKCILRQPQYRSRLVSPAWEQLVDICRCGLNRTSQPVTRHQGQSSEQGAIESELAQLFCVLLSVETIPLTKHTTALLDILLNYFKEREIETSGRAYMLAATNHLLYEIGMGALEELQQFTRAVFPYISTGWDTKDLTVRRLTLQFMQCHFIDLHGFAMDNAINEQYCIDDNGDDNDEDSINSKECENAPTDQLVRKTLQSISLQLSRRPTKKSRTTDFTSLFLTELSRPCSFTTEIHAQTYHQLLFFMLQDTRLACRYFKDEHYLTLVQHLFDCVETARPELQGWAIACIAALIRLASRERIPSLARCLVDECHIDRLLDDIASRFTSAPASTRTAQLFYYV